MKTFKAILFFICIFGTMTLFSEKNTNFNKTLYYLNKQLKLDVTADNLIRACHAKENKNIQEAFIQLKLNETNAYEENKIKVLNAACKGMKHGFARPADPTTQCTIVKCLEGKTKCSRSEQIFIPKENAYCQKPDLNGGCLEFAPCPTVDV